MRRLLLFMVCLLLINIVSAGQTYYLDFSKQPSYKIGLQEGDRVEFEAEGGKHTILVKDINSNKVGLATFINLNKQNSSTVPLYTSISNQKYMKLDVNNDNKFEIYVIYSAANKTAASLVFQLPFIPNKDLEIFSESQFGKNNYWTYVYVFLAILVFLIVILFITRIKKRPEEIKKEDSENKENS